MSELVQIIEGSISKYNIKRNFSNMKLLVAIFGIGLISLTSACGPSLANPIKDKESGFEKNCVNDFECEEGQFCYSKYSQGQCIQCIDCGKWQRKPGSKGCARSREDCGDCLSGFRFEDVGSGQCLEKKEELKMFNNSTKNGESAASSSLFTILGLLLFVFVMAIFAGVGVVGYRHRTKRSTIVEQELMPTAPSVEYAPPPSENPGFRTTVENYRLQPSRSPSSSGYKLLDEKTQRATPFSAGSSYGDETVEFFADNPEQQIVPSNELNNQFNQLQDQVVQAVEVVAPVLYNPIPPSPQDMENDLWEELHRMDDSAVDVPMGNHLNEDSINLEEADRENPLPAEQQDLDLPINDSGFSSSTSNINSPRPSIADNSEIPLPPVSERVPPILPLVGASTSTPNDHCVHVEDEDASQPQVVPSSQDCPREQQPGQLNFLLNTSRSIQRSRLHRRMRRLEAGTNSADLLIRPNNFGETEERMEL